MTLSYQAKDTPSHESCECGHHRKHQVWKLLWDNPSITRKEIARELRISPNNVRVIMQLLHRMGLSRRCPECFMPKLLSGVCQACGFEPAAPVVPLDVVITFDQQSPTNHLQPGNELGSELDYHRVGFTNHGTVVQRWIQGAMEDPLIRAVKSDVMNELKRCYPSEVITDYAGKLSVKEVLEFRAKYPILATSKNLRRQLAANVVHRIKMLYPSIASGLDREQTGKPSEERL